MHYTLPEAIERSNLDTLLTHHQYNLLLDLVDKLPELYDALSASEDDNAEDLMDLLDLIQGAL